MTLNIENLKSLNINEPMVIFPLKQYRELIDYIEEIEDRLTIKERLDEGEISAQDFDKLFEDKFEVE